MYGMETLQAIFMFLLMICMILAFIYLTASTAARIHRRYLRETGKRMQSEKPVSSKVIGQIGAFLGWHVLAFILLVLSCAQINGFGVIADMWWNSFGDNWLTVGSLIIVILLSIFQVIFGFGLIVRFYRYNKQNEYEYVAGEKYVCVFSTCLYVVLYVLSLAFALLQQ